MLDRDPAPEGYRASCLNCGRPLAGHQTASHLPGYERGQEEPDARFCSEECAADYIASDEEEWEEIEHINRAGAT